MDKIKKYQTIIVDFLKEYAKYPYQNTPEIEFQLLTDYEHNHFQLLSIGWEHNKFVYDTIFHFDIKDEKIWIQKNDTDILVADAFIAEGVNHKDIILGFVPEPVRVHAAYSVA